MPDRGHLVIDAIRARMADQPDSTAVECGRIRIGYAELHNLLMRRVAELAPRVVAGAAVAVERPRSLELVLDLLAVLELGAVYVPIDPALPQARRMAMLQVVQPALRVTVDGDHETSGAARAYAADAAYVYFTSGSTGEPKPVVGSATGLAAFLQWQVDEFGIGRSDRVAFLTAPGFDVSLRDMLMPLVAGATVVVPASDEANDPQSTAEWLRERSVTVLHVVPSVARSWLRYARTTCPDVRSVFFAGEPLTAELLDVWSRLFPACRERVNLYGPTETTLARFHQRLPAAPTDPVPVGRPRPGTRFCLVELGGEFDVPSVRASLLGRATEGEIVIVAADASHGYLDRPDETAARFLDLGGGETAYRTGDMGRIGPDGELIVTGRLDDEVKINGVRVNPAESTAALRAHPAVTDGIVLAERDGSAYRLVAYVVHSGDESALRTDLFDILPGPLVPTRFVRVAALPLLANGKVDRAALTDRGGRRHGLAALASDAERHLAALWAELLDVPLPHADDEFFALGGESIVATQLVARIRAELGVDVSLRLVFSTPVLREQAAAVDAARAARPPATQPSAGTPRVDARPAGERPLSSAQRRFWFLQQLDPDSCGAHVVDALQIPGDVDHTRMEQALRNVVQRHEVLRTVYPDRGGEPVAVVLADVDVRLEAVDLRARGPEEVDAELVRLAARPFRLDRDQPVRAVLGRLDGGHHVLLVVVHHIATDERSAQLLLDELAAHYNGSPKPQPTVQYAEVAGLQPGAAADDAADDVAYWREQLQGIAPVLELPLDRSRPPVRSERGAEVRFRLDASVYERIRQLARDARVTPYMVMLAAFGYVLHRHCATDDVVVGSPIAGRTRTDTQDVIGCFINTLVLRLDMSGKPTVRELLQRVADTTVSAYDHQELPFDELVRLLAPNRDTGVPPVVQVLFNHYAAGSALQFGALPAEPRELGHTPSKVDLTCTLVERGDAIDGSIRYAIDLFDSTRITRMADHFVEVVSALPANLDGPITDLPAVPPHDPRIPALPARPQPPLLLHRFERWAREQPDRRAVASPEESATYEQLNDRADRLAGFLTATGVGRGDVVALLLERSVDAIVGMLAAQKAGAAYVCLDPMFPPAYSAQIVATAGAALVLTHDRVPLRPVTSVPLIDLDNVSLPPADGVGGRAPGRSVQPDDLMYAVFTSGSTGAPKGVLVEHGHFARYLDGILDRLALPDAMEFAIVSTFAADLGLTNIYGALGTGGTVHVLPYEWATDPERLADYFSRNPVDVLKLVPSHLSVMDEAGVLDAVVPTGCLILAGEACSWELVERVRAVRPECAVWNNYGPTETTVSVLAHQVPPSWPTFCGPTVPLGTPLPGVQVHVVDEHLRPLPAGTAGELLICGPTVARGYTAEASVDADERFSTYEGSPAYRSGDRVRVLPDGTVEFLGRIDRQSKIRGYRIEPGYVEAVLRRQSGVVDAAVDVRSDETGRASLVAYYVPKDPDTLTGSVLAAAMRTAVPAYAVPSVFVALERLPLNANGKVDRKALPEPDPTLSSGPYTAPRTADEVRLARIWADVLGRDEIGIDDDFFDLGGDSFKAMRVIRAAGGGMRVVSLFQHPTVREFAAVLADPDPGSGGLLVRLSPAPAQVTATVIAIPFGGGSSSVLADLAAALPPDFPLVAIELPGHDLGRPDELLQPLTTVVERCVAEIREQHIAGPIVVYGHCLGAALAHRLAERLAADGVSIVGVVLGGAFPAPRLPGRAAARWAKIMPSDRWRADSLYRDELRAIGGLDAELTPDELSAILRALRHDNREAEAYYSWRLHESTRQSQVHALAVVGEYDRLTEFHNERFAEWNQLCSDTELAVIPGAGHYFLRYQATELAAVLVGWARRRLAVDEAPAGPAQRPPLRREGLPAGGARPSLAAFGAVTAGQVASWIGTRTATFGLGTWVFAQTGSATQFAIISLCAFLPGLLALPFAGAAVDRWNRRSVMIAGDAAAGLSALVLLGLWLAGGLDLWHVYVTACIGSVANSLQQPAYLAATAQLVPKQYLARTNGITLSLVALAQLLGPLLGASLFLAVGLGGVLVFDLVTFLVSLAVLSAVRFPDVLHRRRDESVWREVTGGVRYIVQRPSFVAMVVFFLAYNLVLGFAIVLVPTMVLSTGTAETLGWVAVCEGVGGVVGGLAMALWGGLRRRATGMIGFTALTGAGMIIAGLHPHALFPMVGMAAVAASLALLNGHWQTMIQIKVGNELQGRVIAANRTAATLPEPVGYLVAGSLADRVLEPAMSPTGALAGTAGALLGTGPGRGMALLLIVLGLAQIALTVVGLRWRTLHRMEDLLPDAVPQPVTTFDRDVLQAEADRMLAVAHPVARRAAEPDARPDLDVVSRDIVIGGVSGREEDQEQQHGGRPAPLLQG
jgi:amino acid adenylation domain-containing protein